MSAPKIREWVGRDSAQRFAEVLFSVPGSVVELRVIGVEGDFGKGIRSGYFDNRADLVQAVALIDGQAVGIFATLNPVDPALLARAKNRLKKNPKATTSDRDVPRRRFLLVDVDPKRASGISATEEETKSAYKVIKGIVKFLKGLGFPPPIKISSGNGGHLLYQIDLPADDGGLISQVLLALAFLFNTEAVEVDQTVCNPARISKFPGTMARKGDSTDDRPHRRSRLLHVPAVLEVVPRVLLKRVAAMVPQQELAKSRGSSMNDDRIDVHAFIERHGLQVAREGAWQGGRRWVLGVCPFNADHDDNSAFILQFSNGAVSAGCLHNGCKRRGWRELRDQYEPFDSNRSEEASATFSTTKKPSARKPRIRTARRPFPLHILPPSVQRIVQAVARSRCVDVGSVAGVALAAISSAIGLRRVYWDGWGRWEEICVLWLAVVAESGSRKSIIIEDLFAPHHRRQSALFAKYEAAYEAYTRELDDWNRRQRGQKGEAADAEPKPVEPELVHVLTSDATPEGLLALLRNAPEGILVLVDELTAFIAGLGKYSGKAESDRALYLSLFRGIPHKQDRKSARSVLLEKAAAAIVGGIQPGILRTSFDEGAFASGLVSRFLLVRFRPGVKEYLQGPTEDEVAAYSEFIEGLYSLQMEACSQEGGGVVFRPQRVPIDEDCRELLREFVPDWSAEGLLASENVRAAMSKLEGYALRFALILRVGREVTGEAAPTDPITRGDLENGIELARWFRDEAVLIYEELADLSFDDCTSKLQKRVVVIRDCFDGAVSVREWHKRNTRKKSVVALSELQELVDANLAIWRPRKSKSGGGRPTEECALKDPGPGRGDVAEPDGVSGCGLRGAGGSLQPAKEGMNGPEDHKSEGVPLEGSEFCNPNPPTTPDKTLNGERDDPYVDDDLHGPPRPRADGDGRCAHPSAPRNPKPDTPSERTEYLDSEDADRSQHPKTTEEGQEREGLEATPSRREPAPSDDGREPEDEITQSVMDAFGGELVRPRESCALDPAAIAPGTPPTRACNGCKGRAFHQVPGGPEFVCDKCRPGPGPEGWTERIEATEPSIFESMNRRKQQVERLDTRGLGKKGCRPTTWGGKS